MVELVDDVGKMLLSEFLIVHRRHEAAAYSQMNGGRAGRREISE